MTKQQKQLLLQQRMQAMHIACSPEAIEQLMEYQVLLSQWNEHMNLTGDASFEALLDKHIMDSLAPLTIDGLLVQGAAMIDVGSGAGFPGIPLAIVRPDLRVMLLDSLQKRVKFLNAVIDTLGLAQVQTVHARAEDAAQDAKHRECYDVAAARAVATLPALLELLLPFVKTGGKAVCYKGPSAEAERKSGQKAAAILGGRKPVIFPVVLPELPAYEHCLIVSDKQSHTPAGYPRKAGIPAKIPLGE